MRDFSCFSENGVQVVDYSSSSTSSSSNNKAPQNLVTCVYECLFQGSSCFITITWSKNLVGQGVSIGIQNSSNEFLCKVDIKPWLFTRRKGFKSSLVDSSVVDIYWDFSLAKFGTGPEPREGFYVAVAFDQEIVLILGDLHKEVYKKIDRTPRKPASAAASSDAVFVAKREHIFGKKHYGTKAQFYDKGRIHDITIECYSEKINDPSLVISIDRKAVMQVKKLRWKFRGNQTILVDGMAVHVYWDVHSWFFGSVVGNAVFLFQTSLSSSAQKLANSISSPSSAFSWSGPDSQQGQAFSLILYAWKTE
ncbi:OLC1v1007281C1 [Oldenlandia corymbosa var. corymbosa]|uniref:OLC1v1007281C1 n=1 Tax=Oldenlandia corymbosa var. corymbosa TaxID=529605 RepID=A0AAV1DLN0_OLDCO|nr:OLC1v1007281C1 [Oldenlandia corymbosa var. corymbosa]